MDFENYSLGDPRLNYEWDLQPEADVNADLLEISIDGSVFTINQGALAPLTTYSLKATIYNVFGATDISTGIEYLNFTTGAPPSSGQLSVSPLSGTMFQTTFRISASSWQSTPTGGELFYNVWGVTQEDPLKMVQIGASMQPLDSAGSVQVKPLTLPLLVSIRLEVYDLMGERAIVTQEMNVERLQGYT